MPFAVSHRLSVLCCPPDSAKRPSPLRQIDVKSVPLGPLSVVPRIGGGASLCGASTANFWPSIVRRHRPVATSQSQRVLSSLPESASRPSRLRQTEITLLLCPSKVRRQAPVATFHSFICLQPPESAQRASVESATEFTIELWPSMIRRHRPLS